MAKVIIQFTFDFHTVIFVFVHPTQVVLCQLRVNRVSLLYGRSSHCIPKLVDAIKAFKTLYADKLLRRVFNAFGAGKFLMEFGNN